MGFEGPVRPAPAAEASPMLDNGSPLLGSPDPTRHDFYNLANGAQSSASFTSKANVSWNAEPAEASQVWSAPALPYNEKTGSSEAVLAANAARNRQSTVTTAGSKRRRLAIIGTIVAIMIGVAVAVPVVVAARQRSTNSNASVVGANAGASSGAATPTASAAPAAPTTGGDGSTVTRDDGSTFVYSNKLGGYCTSTHRVSR